ncbi:hypothetical protein M408DRAFT_29157 [Serendipita vermifera MAFF 305830]|uniref:Uncharacterized protein n=1 Tax=Serendipita vermifera MAFF 305830 TaxID=933852 RepID=A0A0C2W622_SERVB|nr:hypothetical protein M408DRAFT_29157 [Serendipita vermifera MAFF 305830]
MSSVKLPPGNYNIRSTNVAIAYVAPGAPLGLAVVNSQDSAQTITDTGAIVPLKDLINYTMIPSNVTSFVDSPVMVDAQAGNSYDWDIQVKKIDDMTYEGTIKVPGAGNDYYWQAHNGQVLLEVNAGLAILTFINVG